MRKLKEQNGFTLIEVIAGFVILSIILISFLSILIQTKKTNASSESIQDATYYAQAEMEEIYLIASEPNSVDQLVAGTLSLTNGHHYTKDSTKSDTQIEACKSYNGAFHTAITKEVVYKSEFNGYTSEIHISLLCKPQKNIVGNVQLTLIETATNILKATIENAYIFK